MVVVVVSEGGGKLFVDGVRKRRGLNAEDGFALAAS